MSDFFNEMWSSISDTIPYRIRLAAGWDIFILKPTETRRLDVIKETFTKRRPVSHRVYRTRSTCHLRKDLQCVPLIH